MIKFESYLIIITILFLSTAFFFNAKKKYFSLLIQTSFFSGLLLLIIRIFHSGHIPLSCLYETMIFFPFLISFRILFFSGDMIPLIKKILILFIILLYISAFILPAKLKTPNDLLPALNSFWMFIHVPAYFIGYVSMLITFSYSMIFLWHKFRKRIDDTMITQINKELKITFLFLNIGLITGAIWAHYSWGHYWAWDPKETWSLITILILSFSFFISRQNSYALITFIIASFISMIFTYWGVPLFLQSIHSY